MKILIIGGSGILSSAVVDCCIGKGYEVTMLNRGNNSVYTNPSARLIVCDARDEKQVYEKTKGLFFDVVIDFIVYNKEQLEKSLSLFGHLAEQYVFISSAQVYNTSIKKVLSETDETPQPLWSYSINKDICEKTLRNYCGKNNINYTIIRPGVNYDNRRIPYGMYPPIGMHWTIVSRILAGKPIIIWNNGLNKLNLTRVEDFAIGATGLFGNPKAYGEAFNVVGDFVYTWKEVLDVLGRIIGKDVVTVDIPIEKYVEELFGEEREMLLGGRACDLQCSNTKLKTVVKGFKSNIALEEGLSMTLDWYRANQYYNCFDYSWDAQQDRIIWKYLKNSKNRLIGLNLKYTNYSESYFPESLKNLITYKLEYYKDRAFPKLIWKCVKKIVYKPIRAFYRK